MLKEIVSKKNDLNEQITTIYFGGGTPSILGFDELKLLIDALNKNYAIAKEVELTVECNPDDLTKQKLDELKSAGVNRLSIGVQSFFDDDLQFFNRAHAANEAEKAILLSQDAGFDNITIDLIYGTPTLTQQKWEKNLKKVEELNIPHLSAYSLTIEPKTAINHQVKTKKIQLLPEEEVVLQFNRLMDFTESIGLKQYEISNFAKEGFVSQHNSNYWKGEKYLGIGPSAHSFVGNKRLWNVSNNPKYINAIENNTLFYEEEIIDENTAYNEYILTRLRTIWGIDIMDLNNKFNSTLIHHFKKEISPFLQNNFVQQRKNVFTLTKKGIFIADKISSDLFFIP
ncbi:MAG: Oxygen-independent coproporphyrinogen-III oxidase-like protein YqeR [Flavobacteriales bacterium]|nr:Oxygen-independent coproporphyrinogen-III oxidase-like protein YqeR [Flavobacteriales bacterium]